MRTIAMDITLFGWGVLKIMLATGAAWIAADFHKHKGKKRRVFISA